MVKIEDMKKARHEYAMSQRFGAHFICASLVIWIFILAVNYLEMSQYYKNALSLYSSAVLVPLALLFSKLFGIRFSEKENPLSVAGLVFALNQMIYLLAVILVWLIKPEMMIVAYAIVVGAHFLPYSWLYDSVVYRVFAILIPVASLTLAISGLKEFVPIVMIVSDIVMIILFLTASGKGKKN